MRPLRWLGPALFVAGVAALVVGFLRGEATLNLFVIFPVITATGAWSALGILLLIAGSFALFVTWASYTTEPGIISGPPGDSASSPAPMAAPAAPSRRWGGVVFLGPIPIVFGSDPKMAKWMIVAGFVLLAALVVLTVIALRVI